MKNPRSKYQYAVRRAVEERDARINQPVILGTPAFLGDASGNITTNFWSTLQAGQVVVRDMSGNLSVAYNQRVPLRAGLPIMVGYDPLSPKIFQVLGQRDWWSVQTTQSLIFHHSKHEFPSEDTVWIKGEQFLPWMAVPSGMTLVIYPAATYTDAGWVLGDSIAVNMTAHVPSYGGRICLITVNSAGEYVVTEGAIVSAVTISITDCPIVPAGHQPLWAVKLTAGQTSIEGVDTTTGRWAYLFDLRWGFSKLLTNVMLTDVYDPDVDGIVLEADFAYDVNEVKGSLKLTGVLTPAQITANQNDYDPTGLSASSSLRLSSNGAFNITGLAGGVSGRVMVVHNIGGTFDLTLKHNDSNSSEGNRFIFPGNADVVISPNLGVLLQYDGTTSRWRIIGGVGSSSGGSEGGSAQLHGIARWAGLATQTTFELPDLPEYIDNVSINGIRQDDILDYSQSADRTQIVLTDALPEDSIVSCEYVVATI